MNQPYQPQTIPMRTFRVSYPSGLTSTVRVQMSDDENADRVLALEAALGFVRAARHEPSWFEHGKAADITDRVRAWEVTR